MLREPPAEHCYAFRSLEEPVPDLSGCNHGARHGNWGGAFDCGRGEPDALCLLDDEHEGRHAWTSIQHVSLVPGPNWGKL